MRRLLRVAVAAIVTAGSMVAATAGTASADTIQTFRNHQSGFCLDDSHDFSLRTFPCNGMIYQKWNVHVFGDGTRQLRNESTKRCFGVERRPTNPVLVIGACAATPVWSWVISRPPNGGIRFFSELTASNHCLFDQGIAYAGGHYVGITGCIGGHHPNDTIWS